MEVVLSTGVLSVQAAPDPPLGRLSMEQGVLLAHYTVSPVENKSTGNGGGNVEKAQRVGREM